MKFNLQQALVFSKLSTNPTDGCTFAPEFGVHDYCVMHDQLLNHFVYNIKRNIDQLKYLESIGLSDVVLVRKDCDLLFREGLNEKIHTTSNIKKLGYWFVKWLYYYAVTLRSRFLK